MSKSILEEAQAVIADRRARVDDPKGNFERIAAIWSVVFGHEVTPKQVVLAMIGLKLAREIYKHWPDNLRDLCGYADCAADIEGYYKVAQEYDAVEELYAFRDKCQQERERDGEPTGPVFTSGPEAGSRDAESGQDALAAKLDAVTGLRYRGAGPEHWRDRAPVGKAFGTHDSGP